MLRFQFKLPLHHLTIHCHTIAAVTQTTINNRTLGPSHSLYNKGFYTQSMTCHNGRNTSIIDLPITRETKLGQKTLKLSAESQSSYRGPETTHHWP
ncbi:Hypothetical predicted protein [Octopus vulgaris]|uniref:Uncharacterized protein n=1 Tax=Octopus vulgaris TaxID=6645 RepID=A0AA36BG86_OCTVU|nr:Hypothetical predicted protein [Octopus vulgaris]